MPSLGIFGGFQEQDANGRILTSAVLGPQCSGGVECLSSRKIQPDQLGQDQLRGFRVGVSLELMTPSLVTGFGEPRLFAHVDPMYLVGFERRIAGNGEPGAMVLSDRVTPGSDPEEAAFTSQGTKLSADYRSFMFNAGLGVAFTFEAFDMSFRIKPSFEYLQSKLTVTGQVNRTVQVAPNPTSTDPGNFRFIVLEASEKKLYHALGPGLEIEAEGTRLGPFTVSPFVAGRAFYFLGDLDVDLRAENQFGEFAEFEFTADEWQWDGRLGIRLRWDPR